MIDNFVKQVGEAPSPQRVLLFAAGVIIPLLLSFTTFMVLKILDHDKTLEVHNIEIKQMVDLAQRIDNHLSNIDSKNQDAAVLVQGLKVEVSSNRAELSSLRHDLERNRDDYIRDLAALSARMDRSEAQFSNRLQQVEILLAPMSHDTHMR